MPLPTGVSLQLSDPLWLTSRRSWSETLTNKVSGYSHQVEALGGYWAANWRVAGNLLDAEGWLDRLGSHVETMDEAIGTCFEGFVNSVTVNAGGRTVTRGPLLDVHNRVYVIYNIIDQNTIPPTSGIKVTTPVANDTDSQSRWGIFYGILTAEDRTLAQAEYVRNMFLAARAEPKLTRGSGAGGETSVQVEVLGYVHLMIWPYNYTANALTIDLSNNTGTGKLQLIMTASPNAIFSTDYTRMVNNTYPVTRYENDDMPAWELIKRTVNLGNTSYQRYLFGLYANRQAVYELAPTDVGYTRRMKDPTYAIRTQQGQEVPPWAVMPGQWLMYTDFNVGQAEPAAKEGDPRMEFIEGVTFNADSMTCVTRGGDTDTINQAFNQWGLGEA